MKKRPKPAKPAARVGGGGYQQPVPVSPRKPPPRKPRPRPVAPGGGGYQQPPVPRKPVAHRKPVRRKLALGEAVACCAAEALAASLRLAGHPVSDWEVLALYELTAEDPDEGATIEATLEAAAEHGLAGTRLLDFHGTDRVLNSPLGHFDVNLSRAGIVQVPHLDEPQHVREPVHAGSLILGADLPGPHALCDDGTWWWSWGQPWDPADFPLAVIEEAWEVTWPH